MAVLYVASKQNAGFNCIKLGQFMTNTRQKAASIISAERYERGLWRYHLKTAIKTPQKQQRYDLFEASSATSTAHISVMAMIVTEIMEFH